MSIKKPTDSDILDALRYSLKGIIRIDSHVDEELVRKLKESWHNQVTHHLNVQNMWRTPIFGESELDEMQSDFGTFDPDKDRLPDIDYDLDIDKTGDFVLGVPREIQLSVEPPSFGGSISDGIHPIFNPIYIRKVIQEKAIKKDFSNLSEPGATKEFYLEEPKEKDITITLPQPTTGKRVVMYRKANDEFFQIGAPLEIEPIDISECKIVTFNDTGFKIPDHMFTHHIELRRPCNHDMEKVELFTSAFKQCKICGHKEKLT
jgi:hypothetical protein